MADAVGIVAQIVDLALMIETAVDTVRQNKEDCEDIKRRVKRILLTLEMFKGREEFKKNQAVSQALEAVKENLVKALELITYCQEERSMCVCFQARSISKQLSMMDRHISNKNLEVLVSITAYQQALITAPSPPPPSSADVQRAHQLRILLQQISEVARQIHAAVGAARQNVENCTAIDKRVNSVSRVLESANVEKLKDPAISDALKKLLETFQDAHRLISLCHGCKTLLNLHFLCLPEELLEVLDQMVFATYNVTSIILREDTHRKALPQEQ